MKAGLVLRRVLGLRVTTGLYVNLYSSLDVRPQHHAYHLPSHLPHLCLTVLGIQHQNALRTKCQMFYNSEYVIEMGYYWSNFAWRWQREKGVSMEKSVLCCLRPKLTMTPYLNTSKPNMYCSCVTGGSCISFMPCLTGMSYLRCQV